MDIGYGKPLSNGWDRMKNALFNPFDIGKWFTVGFTAFLAGLADGFNSGGNSYKPGKNNFHIENIADYPGRAWGWLINNPIWFMLISLGIMLFIVLGVLLLWLSSRGKFIFLDNVVHDRALVSKPWYQFNALGYSLFLWRLIFGIIVFAIVILFLSVAVFVLSYFQSNDLSGLVTGVIIIGMVLWFFVIGIIAGYITLFLSHFIIPIMYKNNISAVEAWRNFMPLFSRYAPNFIIYGIIIFLLHLFVGICVVGIGVFTCCIGFIILSIPYIGTVLLLPVKYTFRAMSIEFLEQFGPEYKIFPKLYDNDLNGV